jgi:hypothetical protein
MRTVARQTLKELLVGKATVSRPGVSERMPIPFTFKPRLPALEAFVEIFASLCRIFLGCLLFAAWGVLALYMRGVYGILVVFPLVLLFLGALAVLMILISLISNKILRL